MALSVRRACHVDRFSAAAVELLRTGREVEWHCYKPDAGGNNGVRRCTVAHCLLDAVAECAANGHRATACRRYHSTSHSGGNHTRPDRDGDNCS